MKKYEYVNINIDAFPIGSGSKEHRQITSHGKIVAMDLIFKIE